MAIKAIIFDVGEVLITNARNDRHYYPYLSKISNISQQKIKKIIDDGPLPEFEKGNMTLKEFSGIVAKKLGIKVSEVRYKEEFAENGRLNLELIKRIKKLRKKYKVAYLTDVDKSRYPYLKKFLNGYEKLFYKHFASCYLGIRKENERTFEIVLKRLGMKGNETLFIDDLKKNVESARKAGIKAIRFKNNRQLEKDFDKLGVHA